MEPEGLDKIVPRLIPILEKYQIQKAVVFGSLARREPSRKSDLDLLVIQVTDKRYLDRYDGILSDITEVVHGRDVDLLIYTPEEFAGMIHHYFIKKALEEGIVIYDSEREPVSGTTMAVDG